MKAMTNRSVNQEVEVMLSNKAQTKHFYAMAISAKESPKNHTDKERFAAASSCIAKEILTLLFARKRRRSTGPVLYQPPRSRSRRVSDLKVPIMAARTLLLQGLFKLLKFCLTLTR